MVLIARRQLMSTITNRHKARISYQMASPLHMSDCTGLATVFLIRDNSLEYGVPVKGGAFSLASPASHNRVIGLTQHHECHQTQCEQVFPG